MKITKDGTLDVTYKNEEGDIVTVEGANIIHKDMRDAMNALIPHLAVMTEQREAYKKNLEEMKDDVDIALKLSVSGMILKGNSVMVSGSRTLDMGKVLNINSPMVQLEGEGDVYEYSDEMYQCIENIKFETEAYVKEKKWALKQTSIDFESGEDNPFKGEGGEIERIDIVVPEVKAEDVVKEIAKEGTKKRIRKPKKAA